MTGNTGADDDVLPFAVQPARSALKTRRSTAGAKVAASTDPIARVAVDVGLPHLDRPFDYLVPQPLAAQALPGVRVRVRFAGQLVDGFVLDRLPESAHEGRLSFLERVVSPEVVLTPDVLQLARAVADRWAGTLGDVLRLAIPPRHAQAEAATPKAPLPAAADAAADPADATAPNPIESASAWSRYRAGRQLVESLRDGGSPRAVWVALPGGTWPAEIAELVHATAASGRGVLIVVPDGRDAARVGAALTARIGAGRHVVLTADLGPALRYRRFLEVSRGRVGVVVGTRAAAFAPVERLGLVVVWDDGDDLHSEPRAPYPHARDVLLLRAHQSGAAAVVGGHAVTAEGARLIATRWARAVTPERSKLRALAPLVVAGDDPAAGRQPGPAARLPSVAWQAAHEALRNRAPVLVQVPRRGYLSSLSCDRCRGPLRCGTCHGPLAASDAGKPPACRWCGRLAAGWRCPDCGSSRFRAAVVGARRTAEELGRAFPGIPVATSAHGEALDRVPGGPSLVIATPGAEPIVDGGYGVALLLDGWAMLSRPDLRAGEETLRRWFNAAALVRAAPEGGRVVVLADASLTPVQALVRWDPLGHAERELAARTELGFPPAVVFAELTGDRAAVEELIESAAFPQRTQVLGPVPVPIPAQQAQDGGDATDAVRALVRAPRSAAAELATALHQAQGVRSARKLPAVRVRIDPDDIG